jgi:glycosyltransferase involved in cell wall biosynthesis
MKLVMLTTSAIHHPGPQSRWIPLARVATQHGITTEVVCLHPDYVNLDSPQQHIDGVLVTHVAQMHVNRHGQPLRGLDLIVTALGASIRMARYTMRIQPQMIGICKAQPINGLAAIIAHRRTGAPLILDIDDSEHESHQFAHAWQKALVARVEHALPHVATSTSVASLWHLHQLTQAGHHNLAHIPNGIACIPTVPERIPTLPEQYIAYVGRIAFHTHAVDLLIDALAFTRTTIPLVIVGSGPDVATMHQRIADHGLSTRCIWLGQVAPATAQAIIAHAHTTVDPVRDTPAASARYPLKIIESLAHGVPVITSDVGDRATMIGTHGRLVSAGHAVALAHAIDDICSLPRLPRTEGQARVAHLTWDQLGPRWLQHHRVTPAGRGAL